MGSEVAKYAHYMVLGKIVGIANVTTGGEGSVVYTNFGFKVNYSLIGDIPTGSMLLISQWGGVANTSLGDYVNDTVAGFPQMRIGSTYILALGTPYTLSGTTALPFDGAHCYYGIGPNGIFVVIGGLVYSLRYVPAGSSSWDFNGVSISEFMETWNRAATSQYQSTVWTASTTSHPQSQSTAWMVSSTSSG
ncbi:MAG: hypothetical protein HY296_03920 [Thaumarchaeota archaeon]|nr:hypothetical protein [Nitrososphaerota archaeon]